MQVSVVRRTSESAKPVVAENDNGRAATAVPPRRRVKGRGIVKLDCLVRVSFDSVFGRVVGRSEFDGHAPACLVEYERHGKVQRDWIVEDKLELL